MRKVLALPFVVARVPHGGALFRTDGFLMTAPSVTLPHRCLKATLMPYLDADTTRRYGRKLAVAQKRGNCQDLAIALREDQRGISTAFCATSWRGPWSYS